MVEEAPPIQGLQTQMLAAAKQTGKGVGGMPPGAVGTKGTGKILLRKSFALTFYNLRADGKCANLYFRNPRPRDFCPRLYNSHLPVIENYSDCGMSSSCFPM